MSLGCDLCGRATFRSPAADPYGRRICQRATCDPALDDAITASYWATWEFARIVGRLEEEAE
jgi:hypothetical protein